MHNLRRPGAKKDAQRRQQHYIPVSKIYFCTYIQRFVRNGPVRNTRRVRCISHAGLVLAGGHPALPPHEEHVSSTWLRSVPWGGAQLSDDAMPPTFGGAPRCPRCNDRVYAAEQVIGPASKFYHRQCLKCVVCNKLLDSVRLLEHDGEPFCNNCHRTHLGQGRDTFGTAVPLRLKINTAALAESKRADPPQITTSSSAPRFETTSHASNQGMSTFRSTRSMEHDARTHRKSESFSFHTQAPPMLQSTPHCARCDTPVCAYSIAKLLTQTLRSSGRPQAASGTVHACDATGAVRR